LGVWKKRQMKLGEGFWVARSKAWGSASRNDAGNFASQESVIKKTKP